MTRIAASRSSGEAMVEAGWGGRRRGRALDVKGKGLRQREGVAARLDDKLDPVLVVVVVVEIVE